MFADFTHDLEDSLEDEHDDEHGGEHDDEPEDEHADEQGDEHGDEHADMTEELVAPAVTEEQDVDCLVEQEAGLQDRLDCLLAFPDPDDDHCENPDHDQSFFTLQSFNNVITNSTNKVHA